MRTLMGIVRLPAQGLYLLLRLRRRRRKVVFLSRQANRPSRDFRMLADELRRRDPSLEVVLRCRFVPQSLWGRIAYVGEVFAQMWHLATASVCVVDGYIVPVSLLDHGPGLTVIQMWHALGAIKRFGLQSIGRSGGRSARVVAAMRMHENYDVVLCGGPGAAPAFAEAFGVEPPTVAVLGLPRVDYLLGRAADEETASTALESLIEREPRLAEEGRVRVLYAPTFRRTGRAPDFDGLVAAFDAERFTLIVKPHDLDSNRTSAAHVVDATGVDALDLLVLCDVLVTDYSAIAFEASVLSRPTYYYVPDIEEYRVEHGLNIDPLAELSEVSSTDAGRIARLVADGAAVAAASEFRERFVTVPESGCTAAIAHMIEAALPGGARDGA